MLPKIKKEKKKKTTDRFMVCPTRWTTAVILWKEKTKKRPDLVKSGMGLA